MTVRSASNLQQKTIGGAATILEQIRTRSEQIRARNSAEQHQKQIRTNQKNQKREKKSFRVLYAGEKTATSRENISSINRQQQRSDMASAGLGGSSKRGEGCEAGEMKRWWQ